MIIYVTLKGLGKRKDVLTKREFFIQGAPTTLRNFIIELVTTQVQQFNEKDVGVQLVDFLTNEEIERQGMGGKVGFRSKYNDQKVDPKTASLTAVQAFEDGLFKVFINEEEQTELDKPLDLQAGDQLTFIKLTMLAGRMW
ncbi:hypothetical protein ACFVSW_13215 [Neobacillus sp. NPDC058068]|uniref:hypothetical protein n=1 Tax=Neobacillus sp. NPDC058068 TaxID=3346325 RepID=UPI0036DBBEDF